MENKVGYLGGLGHVLLWTVARPLADLRSPAAIVHHEAVASGHLDNR